LLDAQLHDHRAAPVGELTGEPAQHRRVAVADVVVDADPAVARRRDERPARVAGKARDELANRLLNGAEVVRLDMDRAERGRFAHTEPALELGNGPAHRQDLLAKAPARIDGTRDQVRRLHLEIEMLEPTRCERPHDLVHELAREATATRRWRHIQIRQHSQPLRASPRERESHRAPVLLRHERDLRPQDLLDLAELLLHVDCLVRRSRHLAGEVAPERGNGVEVRGTGGTHGHA
jgi:hypothetical protein